MQLPLDELWVRLGAVFLLGVLVAWSLTRLAWGARLTRITADWAQRLEASEEGWRDRLASTEEDFSARLDQRIAQIGVLSTDLLNDRARIAALEGHLDQAALLAEERADTLESMQVRLVMMDDRLARSLEQSDRLEVELRGTTADLEDKHRTLDQALIELGAARRSASDLVSQLGRREARIRELEPLEDRVKEREDQVQLLQKERAAEASRSSVELDRLRSRVAETAGLEERIRDLGGKTRDLQEELTERDAQLRELRIELAGLKLLPERLRDRDRSLTALREEVVVLADELEGLRAVARAHDACAAQLAQRDAQIAELRRQGESSTVSAKSRSGGGVALVPAAPRETALSGPRLSPPAPRTVFAFASPERDDLKRIKGIGPVLERTLNQLGYMKFEDIVRWDAAAIDRVAEQLSGFRERIERDEWVRQARELQQEMESEEGRSHGRAS